MSKLCSRSQEELVARFYACKETGDFLKGSLIFSFQFEDSESKSAEKKSKKKKKKDKEEKIEKSNETDEVQDGDKEQIDQGIFVH